MTIKKIENEMIIKKIIEIIIIIMLTLIWLTFFVVKPILYLGDDNSDTDQFTALLELNQLLYDMVDLIFIITYDTIVFFIHETIITMLIIVIVLVIMIFVLACKHERLDREFDNYRNRSYEHPIRFDELTYIKHQLAHEIHELQKTRALDQLAEKMIKDRTESGKAYQIYEKIKKIDHERKELRKTGYSEKYVMNYRKSERDNLKYKLNCDYGKYTQEIYEIQKTRMLDKLTEDLLSCDELTLSKAHLISERMQEIDHERKELRKTGYSEKYVKNHRKAERELLKLELNRNYGKFGQKIGEYHGGITDISTEYQHQDTDTQIREITFSNFDFGKPNEIVDHSKILQLVRIEDSQKIYAYCYLSNLKKKNIVIYLKDTYFIYSSLTKALTVWNIDVNQTKRFVISRDMLKESGFIINDQIPIVFDEVSIIATYDKMSDLWDDWYVDESDNISDEDEDNNFSDEDYDQIKFSTDYSDLEDNTTDSEQLIPVKSINKKKFLFHSSRYLKLSTLQVYLTNTHIITYHTLQELTKDWELDNDYTIILERHYHSENCPKHAFLIDLSPITIKYPDKSANSYISTLKWLFKLFKIVEVKADNW